MITIKAVSFDGQPMSTDLAAEFGEQGGVIGRATGNALVLPDPERFVSRAHAAISFRDGRYVIRDLSSVSPVQVNGVPLGNGREAQLSHGDELRIGAYALQVLPEAAHAYQDPFADLMPATSDHPPQTHAQGGIPHDFDPFADIVPAPTSPPADFGLGLEPDSNADINQLFGLGANSADGLFPDGHPLGAGGGSAGGAMPVDPLVAMGVARQAAAGMNSQRDNTPEIHGAFVPPVVASGNEQKGRQDAQGDPTTQRQGTPADPHNMMVSWSAENENNENNTGGGIKTMVIPSPTRPPGPRLMAAEEEPVSVGRMPATEAAAPPQAAAGSASAGSGQDLLQAFLAGAGVPDLDMSGQLTPEMMRMFGQLLRESTQGTLDLLMARALTKREMHAQMTMIAMHENNPLKFAPNVEVALHSLLAPRGKGFMPPLPAMRDAYDDLRAHQFGVMAGMRAALSRVLHRFDPGALEQRLADATLIDTLLPSSRKAKLWGLYLEMYTAIIKEAEDDFQTWFGREFLSAYDAQMAKLKQDGQQEPQ